MCCVGCVLCDSVFITVNRDGKLKHLGSQFLLEVVGIGLKKIICIIMHEFIMQTIKLFYPKCLQNTFLCISDDSGDF